MRFCVFAVFFVIWDFLDVLLMLHLCSVKINLFVQDSIWQL